MAQNLVLLLVAAILLMGSPGPATISLTATGAAFGAPKGWPYLIGIILGTTGVLVLVAAGVTGVVLAVPMLSTAIVFAAAAYILYLAFRIATAPPLAQSDPEARAPSLAGGFALGISNPKAFAAIGAVYSGHVIVPGDLLIDTIVKVGALTMVIVAVNTAWLYFGSAVAGLLRDPRASRITNITLAVLLVASVALALI